MAEPLKLTTPDVVATTLRDQVYDRLRQAILSGELRAGRRISPQDLAREIGVSTTPVREALRSLEEEGLIETSPRRWTRVATPSPSLAVETYPLIAVLEELAVQSIERVQPELIDTLEEANQEFRKAAATDDVIGCIKANDRFHDALLESSGNATLLRTVRDLKMRVRLLDSEYFRSGAETSNREHTEIIRALKADDPARAAEIIRGQWVRWLPTWGASPDAPGPDRALEPEFRS